MPAMLEDPTSPPIYRSSGPMPLEDPNQRMLPLSIQPKQVTLRDRTTIASLIPFSGPEDAPPRLTAFLCDLLNSEIEKGDTYPMTDEFELQKFGNYWFSNFAAVMILGEVASVDAVRKLEADGVEWKNTCLGSFYVKPNYPGRSSHVCNGGFLVSNASRNRGVGKLMGEGYLEWAPKLGYVYSVFNLVYETNHASIRIWDSLGFKRVGRIKGCGNLKSHPGTFVDAIIFGRDLGPESEDYVSEERFDKIRFYLKHQKYPTGADRAEKSRLRSAATHYHLVQGAPGDEEKLMLKDKEVIADPSKQYEIARQMHCQTHGGINKTTATIAEKYHWVRIKETVSAVIKNCPECKESSKVPNNYNPKPDAAVGSSPSRTAAKMAVPSAQSTASAAGEATPPISMAPPLMQKQLQMSASQVAQPPLTSPLLPSYESSVSSVMASTTPMSRTPSGTRQSPNSRETSTSAPTPIHMPPPPLMHVQSAHQTQTAALTQAPPLANHMTQTLIPPHLNNLNNLNNHLSMTTASISPQGSAVHSPLPNGPASAPITNIHDTFDMQIDPNLLAGIQNTSYPDLGGSGMDTTIQGMGNLDMDTSMHGIADLNAMGLGDPSMHGLADHTQVSHGMQAAGVGMGQLGQQHGVDAGQLLEQQGHHAHDGQREVKSEMGGLGPDGMMLDSDMGMGR